MPKGQGPALPPLPSSSDITVYTIVRRELHNSLSAEVLESPPVAISAASQLRQETGLKEQREGGPLDRLGVLPDAGSGSRTPDSWPQQEARTTGQG